MTRASAGLSAGHTLSGVAVPFRAGRAALMATSEEVRPKGVFVSVSPGGTGRTTVSILIRSRCSASAGVGRAVCARWRVPRCPVTASYRMMKHARDRSGVQRSGLDVPPERRPR